MPVSPTQNSLKRLRKDGWTATVVEHWNPHAKIRQDLFGFVDVMGIRSFFNPVDPVNNIHTNVGVQATSYTNVSARVKKIKESEHAKTWLLAGNAIEVHGWHKKRNRWQCRVVEITLDDFESAV